MPTKTETNWKKYMTIIRDTVFVILFLASVIGWITSETKKKTKLEDQVETLTKIVTEDNAQQLEKINDILSEQQILNGKIIQFMEMSHN